MRLHDWFGRASGPGPDTQLQDLGQQVLDEIKETGAVLSGRNIVEQVDRWSGDHQGCRSS
jgi:hypothetical protein